MSCKFCYKIGKIDKDIIWNVRSCYAEQNIEDYNDLPSEWDNKHRKIEKEYFKIQPYIDSKNNINISIEYRMETDDNLIINPFSECLQITYCPFCGEKISNDIKNIEDEYAIEIDDENLYLIEKFLNN